MYLSKGLRPVRSSSMITPKLYTSLFTEYSPRIRISGLLNPIFTWLLKYCTRNNKKISISCAELEVLNHMNKITRTIVKGVLVLVQDNRMAISYYCLQFPPPEQIVRVNCIRNTRTSIILKIVIQEKLELTRSPSDIKFAKPQSER